MGQLLGRLYVPTMAVAATLLTCWAIVVGWLALQQAVHLGRVGADLWLYTDATRRWLEGGSFYLPHQLAGPSHGG